MRTLRIALVMALLLFAEFVPLQAQEGAALERGEVIIEDVTAPDGVPGLRVSFLVEASREAIWSVLVDYENFTRVFRGVDRLKVLEEDGHGARVEFWVDAVLKDLHYVLYREYVEPGRRLTWRRVSGDLKRIHGSWEILDTDDPDRQLLVYESYVDIGFYPLTWLIREGAMDRAEKMAQRLRDWLARPRL